MQNKIRNDREKNFNCSNFDLSAKHKIKMRITLLFFTLIFIMAVIVSASLGRYQIALVDIVRAMYEKIIGVSSDRSSVSNEVNIILFNIRLPRIAIAILVGAALSAAGTAFQSVFNNPMVSPDVLGASSGAAFFAATAILIGLPKIMLISMSFLGGVSAIVIVLTLCSFLRYKSLLSLILTGMVAGSLFTAAISLLKYMADPTNELPAITYWLMGSFSSAGSSDLRLVALPILLGLLLLYILRYRLNILSMGSSTAQSLGMNVRLNRYLILFIASLLTSSSVAVSGMIAWVGLVIPHFAKLIFSVDARYAIPGSILLGASFMLIVDDLARLLTTSEIPLGVLTAFVGAPFFMFLIVREGRKI